MTSPFSIRAFLRERRALLVHFNTPMSTNHPDGFPKDLRQAKVLAGVELSFSTILATDHGPWTAPIPGDANAGGCVGIVVDVDDVGCVCSVSPHDSGSSAFGSAGVPPTPQSCADSLDLRTTCNEWRVQNFSPVGLFLFYPTTVFEPGRGERDASLDEILQAFPDDRIFSSHHGAFMDYDRKAAGWARVEFEAIIA